MGFGVWDASQLEGSWVLRTPLMSLLITYVKDFGDLGGLVRAVLLGSYKYPEPPKAEVKKFR